MRSFTVVVITIVCLNTGTEQAVAEDYWPLEVGNWWLYEHYVSYPDDEMNLVQSTEEVLLEVQSREEVNGQVYFRLSNGQLLRKDDHGSIVELKGEDELTLFDMSNLEDPVRTIFIPEGAFPLTGGGGSGYPATRALVDGRGQPGTVTVPAGVFHAVFFADGDLAATFTIHLAPGVGPVRQSRGTDLPGHVNSFELLSYRIGGTTYPTTVGDVSWANVKQKHSKRKTEARE